MSSQIRTEEQRHLFPAMGIKLNEVWMEKAGSEVVISVLEFSFQKSPGQPLSAVPSVLIKQ